MNDCEHGKCDCLEQTYDTKYYWVIEGEDSIAFYSESDAVDYDMRENPEYHSYEDASYERVENNIFEVPFIDLTPEQQTYITVKETSLKGDTTDEGAH